MPDWEAVADGRTGSVMTGAALPELAAAERPETLTDLVLSVIRNAIVDHELPAGTRVTEAGLARQLKVSKTPVREALLRLREIGLVEAYGQRGGRIVSPSRRTIEEAYGVREALEVYAAQAAAERAKRHQAVLLGQLAQRSLSAAKKGDFEEFQAADEEVHRLIAEAAGNKRLATQIEQSLSLVSALRNRDVPRPSGSVECARDHVRVANAVRAGDAGIAGREMSTHIRRVAQIVLTAYDAMHIVANADGDVTR
jgi:DNA-binding GntR family transcriptional regulator